MPRLIDLDPFDRHGLVLAIWTPAGLIAATLYHYGLGLGGRWAIACAFGLILTAFACHIIVNVISGSAFTAGELALGLTATGAALLAFGAGTIASPTFAGRAFLPTTVGFVALVAAFAAHLILASGLRSAFESFDAIRSFSARRSVSGNGQGEET